MSVRINTVCINCGDQLFDVKLNTRSYKNGDSHIVIGISNPQGVTEAAESILGLRFSTTEDLEYTLNHAITQEKIRHG